MMELKKRSDVESRFTWDFTDIFASDAAWEEAYREAEAAIERIAPVQGTLGESVEAMKQGLDIYYAAAEKAELVYVYSMLRLNVDNGDPAYQTMNGRRRRWLPSSGIW